MLAVAAVPAAASPPEVTIDPGNSVEVANESFSILVNPNGDVMVADGIFFNKVSAGGQPTRVILIAGTELIVVPGCGLESKFCV